MEYFFFIPFIVTFHERKPKLNSMKKAFITILGIIILTMSAFSQNENVIITDDGSYSGDNSAMLDVKSANKGLLIPRLTMAERDLVAYPANGLIIYQSDNTPGFYYNAGGPQSPAWRLIYAGTLVPSEIHDDDGDTEVITDDNDSIFFNTNGVRRATVLPDGKVGIGLTDPSESLEVDGKVKASNGFRTSQTTGDGVYVHIAGSPSGGVISGSINGFEVAGAQGDGLNVGRADASGVYIESAGTRGVYIGGSGDDGVFVYEAGSPVAHNTTVNYSGFEVAGAEGDGLFVGQAGFAGVYVHHAGNEGFYAGTVGNPSGSVSSTSKNGFEIAGAEDNGLYIGRADENGVYINSTGKRGIYVDEAGNPSTYSTSAYNNGLQIDGAEGHGLFVGRADRNGLIISSTGDDGVYVLKAGNPSSTVSSTLSNGFEVAGAQHYGLYVGNAGYDGVYINEAEDDGISVINATDDGVYISSTGDRGVYVANADGYGIYSNTTVGNQEWGLYTPDKISYYSGASKGSSTYAKNTGGSVLETGDVVCIAGGLERNVLDGEGYPVINIEEANQLNAQAVFGVVEYKVTVSEEIEEAGDDESGTEIKKRFRYANGSVYSGDYLSVIVFGQAEVNVDSKEAINAGDPLVAGNGAARKVKTTQINGITITENTGILGKALESSSGKEKISVFVNCR